MTLLAPPVTVLTSAVGLGVYIPALLVAKRLMDQGYAAETEVLEDYYAPDIRASHIRHREAHHRDFRLAQMAHRMTHDVSDRLDDGRIARLVNRWADEGRGHFVVWSGFWLPVIERLRRTGTPVRVDHCRIDAVPSASFRIYPPPAAADREIWLWRRSDGCIVHELAGTDRTPRPWNGRDRRLVVHGGGWGIGAYLDAVAPMVRHDFAVDLVVHYPDEARDEQSTVQRYMLAPGWEPWLRGHGGHHDFPPMVRVDGDAWLACPAPEDVPFMRTRIEGALAIVSKPGGCTLIDSLATATPLVLLPAYGDAEQANADVWLERGFGIMFDTWATSDFSLAMLEHLHRNLLAGHDTAASYPDVATWPSASGHRNPA